MHLVNTLFDYCIILPYIVILADVEPSNSLFDKLTNVHSCPPNYPSPPTQLIFPF